jgi:hypothetical protein
MKLAANKTIWTKFKASEFYCESNKFIVINIVWKNIYLGFFKFYQPKAIGGGFLIFEWTICTTSYESHTFFHEFADWLTRA